MNIPTKVSDLPVLKQTGQCIGVAGAPCTERLEQTKFPGGTWAPARCPKCRDLLLAIRNANAMGVEHEIQISAREKRMRALRIPPIYEHAEITNFQLHGNETDRRDQRRALDRAIEYLNAWDTHDNPAADFPQIVMFRGEPGSGKGHIAWALTKAIVSTHEITAQFDTCANIIRDLRQSWGRNAAAPSELDRLTHYRELGLLVIDEVSEHALYGEPKRHLYDLLAHREQWLRPTIVTTNETLEELSRILGPALVSRAEGWGGVLEFGSSDYRTERRKLRATQVMTRPA